MVLLLGLAVSFLFAAQLTPPRMPPMPPTTRPTLPRKLLIGYCNWSQCDDKIVDAVRDGVNVVIWFSVNLGRDAATGQPAVQGGPDLDCVADVVERIRALDTPEPVIHLMAIGGWNSPHPDTSHSPETVFLELDRWNREVVARPEKGWYGFCGYDFDIEGNDDVENPGNHFSKAVLDMIGRIAQLAKTKGYIVSMAPAESYLDPFTSEFSRSLRHDYPEWRDLQPDFKYHSRNVYAYILSRYGHSLLPSGAVVRTFDFVTVQLYEGYSHAEHALVVAKRESVVEYLSRLVSAMNRGWAVDFSCDAELEYPDPPALVSVPPSQLVLGLANGWAGDGKFLLLDPSEMDPDLPVRGYAFWNIKDEGIASVRDPSKPVWLAKSLSKLLKLDDDTPC